MVNPGLFPGVRSNMQIHNSMKSHPEVAIAFAPITVPDLVASTVVDTALLPIDIFSSGRRTKTVYENSGNNDILDVFTMRYNSKGQLDGKTILTHNLPNIPYKSKYTTWGESPVITQHIQFKNGLAVGESYSTDHCGMGKTDEIARGTYKNGREYSGTFFLRDKNAKSGGYILEFKEGKQVSKKSYHHKQMGSFD
jgi:uncharacterized protein YceK